MLNGELLGGCKPPTFDKDFNRSKQYRESLKTTNKSRIS